jgi:hypothetical protein
VQGRVVDGADQRPAAGPRAVPVEIASTVRDHHAATCRAGRGRPPAAAPAHRARAGGGPGRGGRPGRRPPMRSSAPRCASCSTPGRPRVAEHAGDELVYRVRDRRSAPR